MNKGESAKRRAQEAQGGGALCLSDRASGRGVGASPGLWIACRSKINTKGESRPLIILKHNVDIQQQNVPPPPPSTASLAAVKKGDVPFEISNAQNDRLVQENEIVKQKLRWIQSVRQQFRTQSGLGVADPDLQQKQRQSDNIGYGSGCLRYYDYTPQWKDDDNPDNYDEPEVSVESAVLYNNFDIHLSGKVSESADKSTLEIQAEGFELTKPVVPQFDGQYYTAVIKRGDYRKPDIESSMSVVAKICKEEICSKSSALVNLFELHGILNMSENLDFSTQSIRHPHHPLKSFFGNKLFFDAEVRLSKSRLSSELASWRPTEVKGKMSFKLTHTQEQEVFNSKNHVDYTHFQADYLDEEGGYFIFRDHDFIFWEGQDNNSCRTKQKRLNKDFRVPAGVYYSEPFDVKDLKFPYIAEELQQYLPTKVKTVKAYNRFVHECPPEADGDYKRKFEKILRDFRKARPNMKQSLPKAAEEEPLAVGSYALKRPDSTDIVGQYFAISGKSSIKGRDKIPGLPPVSG